MDLTRHTTDRTSNFLEPPLLFHKFVLLDVPRCRRSTMTFESSAARGAVVGSGEPPVTRAHTTIQVGHATPPRYAPRSHVTSYDAQAQPGAARPTIQSCQER